MKWSDGAPLTSDDFLFMYEDWMLNTDLTRWLRLTSSRAARS